MLDYLGGLQFNEPAFVFVVMVVAASRPVLHAVSRIIQNIAGAVPLPAEAMVIWLSLSAVPLLGHSLPNRRR